ncbi:hypothetical protein LDL76_08685 [Salegentibacter mishustinae]|uniref:hypothetical protein n=1 Tax=Salegentibacter mishustinae TaxID=270918 RepID=UPI001CE16B21|nr:hypothetical protein [Salegentibacter mishustinae]UBZ08773.1 hypothetical protein LDL76_08685 [Salegentibacter mishustinae]
MKSFEVYRNIRKRAMIWGLPVSLFALMMIAVVGSLLVIIFSFSLGAVISVFIFNCTLYISLTRLSSNPRIFQVSRVFPKAISVKRSSNLHYEQD